MTDREKLIEILAKYFTIGDSYEYSLTRVKEAFAIGTMTLDDFVEFDDDKVADIADHLISHGVYVRKSQKPCKFEEISLCDYCWIEYKYESFTSVEIACVLCKTSECCRIDFVGVGSSIAHRKELYNKTWRCWAEKPTDAERKNAKWEE